MNHPNLIGQNLLTEDIILYIFYDLPTDNKYLGHVKIPPKLVTVPFLSEVLEETLDLLCFGWWLSLAFHL
jgi:hypothetical protein